MGGRYRHIIRPLAWMLLVVCLYLSAAEAGKTINPKKIEYLSLAGQELNGKQAAELQDREARTEAPQNFTLWGMEKEQQVKNKEFQRSVVVNILAVCGASDLVMPSGQILFREDREGCIIDGRSAYLLFGSRQAVGLTVEVNQKDYLIREVVESAEQFLLVQADEETTEILDTIAVEIPKGSRSQEVLRSLQEQYGFSNQRIRLQNYAVGAAACAAVGPLLLLVSLLVALARTAAVVRSRPVLLGVTFVLGVVLVVSFWCITGYQIHWPVDLIPDRWSDLQFWTSVRNESMTELLRLVKMEAGPVAISYLVPFWQAAGYAVLVIILFLLGNMRQSLESGRELLLMLLVSQAAAFIGVLWGAPQGPAAESVRMIQILPGFYLFSGYIVRCWEENMYKLMEE